MNVLVSLHVSSAAVSRRSHKIILVQDRSQPRQTCPVLDSYFAFRELVWVLVYGLGNCSSSILSSRIAMYCYPRKERHISLFGQSIVMLKCRKICASKVWGRLNGLRVTFRLSRPRLEIHRAFLSFIQIKNWADGAEENTILNYVVTAKCAYRHCEAGRRSHLWRRMKCLLWCLLMANSQCHDGDWEPRFADTRCLTCCFRIARATRTRFLTNRSCSTLRLAT
jgi:hypothetical protein